MIHQTTVEKYQGTLNDLATDIGDLRYDTLSEFLELLSQKIRKDGDKDQEKGRVKLANQLHESAEALQQSKINIDEAWRISEPFM